MSVLMYILKYHWIYYSTLVVCHHQVYENEVKRRFKKELCFGVKVLKIFNV